MFRIVVGIGIVSIAVLVAVVGILLSRQQIFKSKLAINRQSRKLTDPF